MTGSCGVMESGRKILAVIGFDGWIVMSLVLNISCDGSGVAGTTSGVKRFTEPSE